MGAFYDVEGIPANGFYGDEQGADPDVDAVESVVDDLGAVRA